MIKIVLTNILCCSTLSTPDGLVLTPKTFSSFTAGILARKTDSDQADMKKLNYDMVSIVVCNLYPFSETVAKPDCIVPTAVENIDIGKPITQIILTILILRIIIEQDFYAPNAGVHNSQEKISDSNRV